MECKYILICFTPDLWLIPVVFAHTDSWFDDLALQNFVAIGGGGQISSLGEGECESPVKYLLVFEFVLMNLPQCTFILRLQRWRDLPNLKKKKILSG